MKQMPIGRSTKNEKKKRHWSKQKRVAAIRNIEDIKRPESLLICLKCLADSHGDVRQEAVVKLRYEGAVDVSLIVAIMLKDESYFVRLEAAKTLGVLRSKATVYNLFKALGDEHGLVRKAAKESLSTMLPMVSEINIDSERENLRIEIAKWINWWVDARIDFPHIDKTALPGSEFKTPMAPVFSGNKIQNVGNRANPERLGEQPKTTRGAEGVFQ